MDTYNQKKKKKLISFNKNFRHKYQNNSVKKKKWYHLKIFFPLAHASKGHRYFIIISAVVTLNLSIEKKEKKVKLCIYYSIVNTKKG